MNEIQQSMKILQGDFSTSIQKYPSGKYGIVGSIPYELTKHRGGLFPGRKSMVWDTEKEVIEALLKLGITKFQLADCSWYKPLV